MEPHAITQFPPILQKQSFTVAELPARRAFRSTHKSSTEAFNAVHTGNITKFLPLSEDLDLIDLSISYIIPTKLSEVHHLLHSLRTPTGADISKLISVYKADW